MNSFYNQLKSNINGEVYFDSIHKNLYATDASVYKEYPLGVVYPKDAEDVQIIIQLASKHNVPLIPRAGGTSLAGQVVGHGLVIDCSRFMCRILEFNAEEKSIWVEPGVIRDDLNDWLKPYGLFFGPNTSTSNRCTIGGMVGNNSSGTTSIKYGVTRDHVLELKTILSNASNAHFKSLSPDAFYSKKEENSMEAKIYQWVQDLAQNEDLFNEIQQEFPKKSIHRRNTGYALDSLSDQFPVNPYSDALNLCSLITGSEGTLCFTTAIKLKLSDLPPEFAGLVCLHFDSLEDAMRMTVQVMKEDLYACELMDRYVMDAALSNPRQKENSFFIKGQPQAILCLEFRNQDFIELSEQLEVFKKACTESERVADYTVFTDSNDIERIWEYRKAGLGVLSNLPGDAKPVACVEDTAVALEELPDFVAEMQEIFQKYHQNAVFYAHAGAGELHVRPILNLKSQKDQQDFKNITNEVAILTKKYAGSLSGEHGDGRVRAPYIPLMYTDTIIKAFKELKHIFDPNGIMNPGKIVDPKDILEDLRYKNVESVISPKTMYDFGETGFLAMAERCNGSGDCRKSAQQKGSMCPTYHATQNEMHSTRGRANTLRNFIGEGILKENPWNHREIKEVLDLCLSCKACTTECPSNVNMTLLKSEFYHQYYQQNNRPFRDKAFANNYALLSKLRPFAPLVNWGLNRSIFKNLMRNALGIAKERKLPSLSRYHYREEHRVPKQAKGKVILFVDEFYDLEHADLFQKTTDLIFNLGFEIKSIRSAESGRAAMSKGILLKAKKYAEKNVHSIFSWVENGYTLIGIEPSSILSFREEYPLLLEGRSCLKSEMISSNCLTFEEWFFREIEAENILSEQFDQQKRNLHYHAHCHQKSLTEVSKSLFALGLPVHHEVKEIPSGCCGMAGAFGYEKEHYDLSKKIAELKLVPYIQNLNEKDVIVSSGFSCLHQIQDFTDKKVWHPVEIFSESLKKEHPS